MIGNPLAQALFKQLIAAGKLPEEWRSAYSAVLRETFVPTVAWAVPDGPAPGYGIDRDHDADAWSRAVYSDASIVTQLDGGTGDLLTGKGNPTSSLSAPRAVFNALDALGIEAGHRVFEVGTGTGWTTSLLSSRLGSRNVFSVEVDEQVAAAAAANISRAGYTPTLIVGDGADGLPDAAPFDRVHSTCAVETIPYAWVRDTRPGGVIVTPWTPTYGDGLLARLVVTGDGRAFGRFPTTASYMMMRAQDRHASWSPHHTDEAHQTTTTLDPRTIAHAPQGAALFIASTVRDVVAFATPDADGGFSLLLAEAGRANGAWAAVDYTPDASQFEVTWFGERALWDEVSAAYFQWVAWGQPERERFGITVAPEGQFVWVDHPRHTPSMRPL
ncbi:protein-L-isoaspartate O-methyltransferase [Streptomyces spiroverticillatus]|uniref:Protein-L-isoaspartate O-methyltransferase n=1 Tax=Streptomyces finlayi TaxID=67296 RepID=A0A918WTJ5_9ACTN|nr:methyltransferase domain-containing protein [Streptomyces finlayi]GGZ96804.1 protein-L-isoaspartate O-methyltransferase [Streptomyces spiroverticillatus]GHC82087.1 protein-L-isoaspartate O-methyltransferase [Streptomyces finlayi]